MKRAGWIAWAVTAFGCAPSHVATPYPSAPPPERAANPEPATAAPVPVPQAKVRYFDREVDVAPFLVGFPYDHFEPSLRTDRLFFLRLGDAYTLKMLDLAEASTPWDLDAAATVSEVDWSERSLWSVHHHAATQTLWLHADEHNDERMNLWTLSLETGALEQVTRHDYVYGFGFDEAESQVGYLARTGAEPPFRTCLQIRTLATGEVREVVCDAPALRFTWSDLRFSPEGDAVYFNAQREGQRDRVQLVRVDLQAPSPAVTVVTDPKRIRNTPQALRGWLGDELFFLANDDGLQNLYAYDRKTGKVAQRSDFDEDVTDARLTEGSIIGVHGTPAGSTLFVLDPRSGEVLDRRRFPGRLAILDAHEGRAILHQTGPATVFEAYEATIEGGELARVRKVSGLPGPLEDTLVRCQAEAVRIPTFDVDPKAKRPRELHAFLLTPRDPVDDPRHALAFVRAFYGGQNVYEPLDHILCAAGFTVVSPAVRGSTGFGREFASLNDRDLGGAEIADLFEVGRWTEARLGLSPYRIGVYGRSHGGYATMRALTAPRDELEVFPFGFGMADAGFSDILSFYERSNIPDWVVLESGDPADARDRERMKDRSPLTHVGNLRAPLLLTHGSQDARVPVEESRRFAQAAKALGLPVNYVEVAGQGHRIEGLDLQAQLYQARFDFLEAVAEAAPAAAE